MAKIVENEKNFKVIQLTKEDTKKLHWGIQGNGDCLCMHCNNIIQEDAYYIIVLGDVMDKECYEKWLSTAINYPEDRIYEDRHFNRIKELLQL